MSQHPSLRSKGKGTKFRSVLKRFERLRHLIEKEKWGESSSIFGLPKIKMIRFKIKKEKAAPEEAAAAGAEGAVEGAEAKTAEIGKEKGAKAKKEAVPKKETPSKKEGK